MNKGFWWAAIIVVAVVVLALVAVMFMAGARQFGGWQADGWGRMGPGMMGGWNFSPHMWVGMLFLTLIPLGFIGMLVLGVVLLVKALSPGGRLSTPARTCPNCNRAVQADWQHCAYCGQTLS